MTCWLHFGCQNRPKSGQDRSKMALEAVFVEKREFSRNIGRRNVWGLSRAPRRHPKRHKIAPRWLQDSLISVLCLLRFLHRFLLAFWCDFGAIWGCFGEGNIGHFLHRFSHGFFWDFPSICHANLGLCWPLRRAQDASKTAPKTK